MRKPGILLAWAAAIAIAAASGCASATVGAHGGGKGGSTIDGNSYEVSIAEKGKPDTAETVTLIFNLGNFKSEAHEKLGFVEASYNTMREDNAVHFDSHVKSPAEGEMLWRGFVVGESIQGTATWTRPGQRPIDYTFTGKLKS